MPENLFKEEYKQYFKRNLFETILTVWQHETDDKFKQIDEFLKVFKKQSVEPFDKGKKENGVSVHTQTVKNLVEEGYLRLYQLTKYHNLEKKGKVAALPIENKFYDILTEFWQDNQIVTYHKAFQTTLTKKPYSEDKIKLNFECGTLLDGWSPDYESFGSLIFYKDNKYYLGIIKGTKFDEDEVKKLYKYIDVDSNNKIKRLVYKTQKIDNKNPPRWFIRSKGANFSPMVRTGLLNPKNILDIYDNKLYSKTENKESYKEYLPKLIDYFKEGFIKHQDFKNFTFDWLDSKDYETVADFYNHTADMCYKLDWEDINLQSLIDLADQGRIYLFQIYNKDFELDERIGKSKYDKFTVENTDGLPNSHTLLFKELLKPENTKRLKLLGGGELFLRKPSKDRKYKKDKKGKKVLDAKRYYEQKYFLHFPIQIKGKDRNLKNSFVNQIIQDQFNDIKIIGIDRGEKHLLYYSIIDSLGNMINQGSLNRIPVKQKVDEKEVQTEYDEHGKPKKVELISTGRKVNYVDYRILLDYYEKKRIIARRSWEVVGKIKDLKEGYLSQAIHKIYRLIIKHNAVVVMENLNAGFQAKRLAAVEKSVYKKFELALLRKLNHLILKDKNADEPGGLLNAYQLTPYIEAGKIGDFEKLNQWGILFYVRANYTSITDPLTGWRKHEKLYISNSETEKKIKEFFNPDSDIQINYDFEKRCFKFSYTENNKPWDLFAFSELERFRWDNKNRKMKQYDLHKEFQELFDGFNTAISINQQVFESNNFDWKRLVFLWNLLVQIRNTDRNNQEDKNDFIQSPVWSEKHRQFFDSRKVKKVNLPQNGDANGAYNIARKGFILLKRIKNCEDISKFGGSNYYIDDVEDWDIAVSDWDKYVSRNQTGKQC